jgi:hypothetical protein
MAPPRLNPSVLAALGLIGACKMDGCGVGPCLDVAVDTDTDSVGPCLSPIDTDTDTVGPCLDYDTDTDTDPVGPCLSPPIDTDTDTDTAAPSERRGGRADARERVLDRGVLPADVAERLRRRSRP